MKRRPGRPRTGNARGEVVPVRVNKEEREMLAWLAGPEPVSTLVRRIAVDFAIQVRDRNANLGGIAASLAERGLRAEATAMRQRAEMELATARRSPTKAPPANQTLSLTTDAAGHPVYTDPPPLSEMIEALLASGPTFTSRGVPAKTKKGRKP